MVYKILSYLNLAIKSSYNMILLGGLYENYTRCVESTVQVEGGVCTTGTLTLRPILVEVVVEVEIVSVVLFMRCPHPELRLFQILFLDPHHMALL